MDPVSAFGFKDLLTSAVTEMAKAVSERDGESPAQQFARCQDAVHMIMGFQPRDVLEVLLAGHCVMLHEVLTVDVRDSLRAEAASNRRSVVTLNKAFNDNLDRLERYRQRPAEGRHDASEAVPVARADAVPVGLTTGPKAPPAADAPEVPVEPAANPAPEKLNRAARRQAARDEMLAAATTSRMALRQTGEPAHGAPHNASSQTAHHPKATTLQQPTHDAVTACRANPEAMTALATGDPARFARAPGVATPSEALLAAANSRGSPFDRQAMGPWPMSQAAATRKG